MCNAIFTECDSLIGSNHKHFNWIECRKKVTIFIIARILTKAFYSIPDANRNILKCQTLKH